MRYADIPILALASGASSVPSGAEHSQHVSSALADPSGEGAPPTIEVFQTLATVPPRRPTVAGAAMPRPDARHVMGGARVATGGARAVPLTPRGAAVLRDGTRIAFSSMQAIPEPEPA